MAHPESVVQIVEDDAVFRELLESLLGEAGFQTRTHDSAGAFLAVADTLPPGCIVTDIRMPQIDGLELIARLKAMGVGHPVIVISGHGEVPLVVEAMRRGAIDFLKKPLDPVTFLDRVRWAVEAGPSAILSAARIHAARRALETLSAREYQVLERLMQGKSAKQIAVDLRISSRTVEEYRANLSIKMSVSSFSELVQVATLALK